MGAKNYLIPDFRLSYSSGQTFLGCKRRFWHQKVNKTKFDPDYVENYDAFNIGKAFHEVLEICKHDEEKYRPEYLTNACRNHNITDPREVGLILGMVSKYIKLHKESGLVSIGEELKISNPKYLGFVDVVMVDKEGGWWIVDLKTASKFNKSLVSRLAMDPQLNLYASFRGNIAKQLGIKVEDFKGVRYRVTTKTTIVLRQGESPEDYAQRIQGKIMSADLAVPAMKLSPEKTYKLYMGIYDEMAEVFKSEEDEVPQNWNNCESFFRPCPYWSQCYNRTFTGNVDEEITVASSDEIDFLTSL